MLGVLQFEELEHALLDVTKAIDRYDRNDPTFVEGARVWLSALQEKLGNNRLSVAGRVATVRAELDAAWGPRSSQRPRPRRPARNDGVVRGLRQVVDIVYSETDDTRRRMAEADALARRVVVLGAHKGLLSRLGEGGDWARASEFYGLVERDGDLVAGIVQLNVLLGRQDTVIVLSRRMVDMDEG